jgi:hypothetical protein
MTITYNQHLMIVAARGVATLPLYGMPFSCECLSFDYNWDSEITFRVKVVEDGVIVMVMNFTESFHHLTFTFCTGTLNLITLLYFFPGCEITLGASAGKSFPGRLCNGWKRFLVTG